MSQHNNAQWYEILPTHRKSSTAADYLDNSHCSQTGSFIKKYEPMIGQYLNQSNSVQTDILPIGRHKTNAEPIISLGNDVMSIFN